MIKYGYRLTANTIAYTLRLQQVYKKPQPEPVTTHTCTSCSPAKLELAYTLPGNNLEYDTLASDVLNIESSSSTDYDG